MTNSSFAITKRGSRAKVKETLAAEFAQPKEGNQTQVKAVVAYLITLIDDLPEEFNAVQLTANGEFHDNRYVLQTAVVQGQQLDI